MENMTIAVVGKTLTITIPDVTVAGKPSSTGKTRLIATTGGAQAVDHPKVRGLKVALNVMVPV